jgi:hypothetical protein
MPTKAQLDTQAEQLRKSIQDINESDRSDDEKGQALDKVYDEYKTYSAARESQGRSDEMLKALSAGTEAPGTGEARAHPQPGRHGGIPQGRHRHQQPRW